QSGYELPKELLRSAEPSETFLLTVDGESMIEAGIFTGDLILVTRSFEVRDGDIVVARIGGETATVKRIFRENGHIRLQPENSAMDPIIVRNDEVELVGKVIGLIRSY
ncbi:MAG: repressor LexA, partial [Clostridia bacterium]|nr:repressor LexA [Clostridia bacterium]